MLCLFSELLLLLLALLLRYNKQNTKPVAKLSSRQRHKHAETINILGQLLHGHIWNLFFLSSHLPRFHTGTNQTLLTWPTIPQVHERIAFCDLCLYKPCLLSSFSPELSLGSYLNPIPWDSNPLRPQINLFHGLSSLFVDVSKLAFHKGMNEQLWNYFKCILGLNKSLSTLEQSSPGHCHRTDGK